MAILIIHLSDIHLGCAFDFAQRAEGIADAAFSTILDVDEVHIVVSGDITNTGSEAEFCAATEFFGRLSKRVEALKNIRPLFILAAGNHDCDFSGDQSVRQTLLKSVRSQPAQITSQIALQIASALKNFYRFQENHMVGTAYVDPWTAIAETHQIRYVVLNSSVFSQLTEEQGKLYVRVPELEYDDQRRTVFVMHHPFGWLMPENAYELSRRAPVAGDLFLLGHEHTLSAQRVIDLYDQSTIAYLKGHVFGEAKHPTNSAFQTIQIDNATGFQQRTYRWVDGTYRLWEEKSQTAYILWPSRSANGKLVLTAEGYDLLNSPGASFTHRRKDKVTLQDIFVWPNLKPSKPERESGQLLSDSAFISAAKLIDDFSSLASVVVIKGGEQHGKSTLAKTLCLQLQRKNVCPLLIDASAISSWKERSLEERIQSAVEKYYGAQKRDTFWKLTPADRVLVVDSFDLTQLVKGYLDGLRILRKHFGKIILLLDGYPGMEVALSEFLLDENLADSQIFEILPTTFHTRLELIERWLSIGQPSDVSRDALKVLAAKMGKVVDETIGRNLIPPVPLFVLIILQRAEVDQDLDTVVKSGSHGFLYESLILQALSSRVHSCNIVTSLTYLTALAARMDETGADEMTQAQFEKFHVQHCERFDLELSIRTLQTQLVEADLIDESQGVVRFKYPFHEYYFLARHLSLIDDWQALEARIDTLVTNVHSERNANVLLFLAHLKRNPKIADKILAHATVLFSSYEEVDLFSSTLGIPSLRAHDIRLILFEGSRSTQLALHQQDERDSDQSQKELSDAAEQRMEERLSDVIAMNGAFKTLQVLGQVLRNHAGEIQREEKHVIANTCISMGLRILSFLYKIIADHGHDLLHMRAMQIKAEKEGINEVELAEELEGYLPSFVSSLTVGTLIKIANAVGSEELSLTLKDVLGSTSTRRLVRLATQLEHFSNFPLEDLQAFDDELLRKSPPLPISVLRRFLIRRFYLFPIREELRRTVLDRFQIRALPFQMLEQKKLPRH